MGDLLWLCLQQNEECGRGTGQTGRDLLVPAPRVLPVCRGQSCPATTLSPLLLLGQNSNSLGSPELISRASGVHWVDLLK